MWVADSVDGKLYAYRVSSKSRDISNEFDTLSAAGNDNPTAIWSDGATMWVSDGTDHKVYSYNMPPSSDTRLSGLTVSPRDIIGFAADRTDYEVGVASTITRATITGTANHSGASVAYSPTDAYTSTTVYDVDLTAGRNAVTVTVTAQDGSTTKDYTVSVNRGVTDNYGWKAVDDLDGLIAAGNTSPVGIWSDGTTMWVSDSSEDKLYAYGMSDKAHDASKDFNTLIAAGNENPTGIWSDDTTMWVADWTDHKLYAYRMTDKAHDESKDFETLIAAGNENPTGIWSDGTTMWVVDGNDKIFAYRMSDKVRDESKDFETLIAADNEAPWGIWSDGTTMWVSDYTDDKIYAYNLDTKARDSTKDFNTLIAAGNENPTGIWSDGMTMWVADAGDDKVYSYNKFHTVSFGAAAYTVAEGGSVTVSVTLSADPERTVEIPITTTNEGGATGADYSGVPARVTFNAGDTAQTFTFTATDDAEDDDDESVRLSFGTLPTGVTAGSTATGTVSITDNDDPAVTVSFEQAGYTVAEGSSVTVRVTLSADPERTVEIPITKTNVGGATAADYSGVPASVTFDSGDTAQTFTFTATDDAENDDGESVSIGFGTLPDQVTAGTPGEATVSITDDAVPSVTISFEQAAYAVAEGSSVTVRVTLSADPERTVTVPITKTNQDGATGADYSGVPANVTFNSGETATTFTFTATDDAENDNGESVRLAFGSLPTGVAGSTATGTVSITDDDDPSVTVSFEQAAYTVAEGSSVTVRVTLSADPERTVEIPITTTNVGGATGADYSGVPTHVTFNSGETAQTFTFTATDDAENDDGESVRLSFGALPDQVTAGTPGEATVITLTQSSDATLSALTVSPRDIIGFAVDRTDYEVGVASTITRATITGTANHSGASVAYSPTDADTSTTVYDVDLTAGRNAVTVTVTAQDGSTTKDYTVSVNRGVTDNYGWKAVDDLDGLIAAGNTSPVGIWSDGTTMWVSDSSEDKLYAYGMSDKAHDASKDFNTLIAAGNENPTGIWSDDTTMWVADWTDHKLYAYRMTDKAHDESKDFETLIAAGNEKPYRHLVRRHHHVGGRWQRQDFRLPDVRQGPRREQGLRNAHRGGQRSPLGHLVRRHDYVGVRLYGRQDLRLQPGHQGPRQHQGLQHAHRGGQRKPYRHLVRRHDHVGGRCRRRQGLFLQHTLARELRRHAQRAHGQPQGHHRLRRGPDRLRGWRSVHRDPGHHHRDRHRFQRLGGLQPHGRRHQHYDPRHRPLGRPQRRNRNRDRRGWKHDRNLHGQRQPGSDRRLRLEGRGRPGRADRGGQPLPLGHLVRRHDHVGDRIWQALRL